MSEVEATLRRVVGNDTLQFKSIYDTTESPVSELREDVLDAVGDAVNRRYPDVQLLAYMESGGTDGMHFRSDGIPTCGQRDLHEPGPDVRARIERASTDQGVLRRARPLEHHHPETGRALDRRLPQQRDPNAVRGRRSGPGREFGGRCPQERRACVTLLPGDGLSDGLFDLTLGACDGVTPQTDIRGSPNGSCSMS